MAIIGIDLGTTNSLAVTYQHGDVVMIPNTYGDYLTPSVVSIDDNNQVIVGKSAKQRLVSHPEDTTSLFKRDMGVNKKTTLKNQRYLPEELSAFVVKQLVEDAELFLKDKVEEIVISVPAYFDNAQRSATKRIGDILDIKVNRLINEPSAASIACHYGIDEDESFIVFDFGGGTLDVSVVDCFDNVVSICSIAGDNALGGSDFDDRIAIDFCEHNGLNFNDLSKQYQESLLYNCENAKIALQNQQEVEIMIHMEHLIYTYTLTNEKLALLGKPLFEKMKTVIAAAVNSSGFKKEEIHKMVMVGGSCHMHIVIKFLIDLMNVEVYEGVNKDEIVAKGLGIYVGIKQRSTSIKELVLTDICPFSLSNSVHNENDHSCDLASVIIPKNSVLPTSKTQPFHSVTKSQKEVRITIHQGESLYANQNKLLAEETIVLPKSDKIEYFDVTFIYDINSILCAQVHMNSTGKLYTFGVGDVSIAKEHIDKVKNASMKLRLEPQLEYLEEQVGRIMAQSPLSVQEWIKSRYLEFMDLMHLHQNNLRKRGILMQRMQEIVNDVKTEMEQCDFFNVTLDEGEEDTRGYLS